MSKFDKTPDEKAEIHAIEIQLKNLHTQKDYKRGDDYELYNKINAIKYAALKRATGLDQYMTVELTTYRDEIFRFSIISARPMMGRSINSVQSIEITGNTVRKDGTVGVKSEIYVIHNRITTIKRRHIDGSWTKLPDPKSYLSCD